jgi:hypothetical protein
VQGRLKLWDLVLALALVLMLVGMFLPWWSLSVADMLGDLGLPGDDLLGESALLGFSTVVTGWSAPLAGVGIAAVVLNLVALMYAALKLSFPARLPLPSWYKEGWFVGTVGSVCTVFGIVSCLVAPAGGFALWSWRPGSLLVLVGGAIVLTAGVVMARDLSGDYQGPGKFHFIWPARPGGVTNRCARCDAALQPGDAFCSGCGRRV